jgi:hypothetical protein
MISTPVSLGLNAIYSLGFKGKYVFDHQDDNKIVFRNISINNELYLFFYYPITKQLRVLILSTEHYHDGPNNFVQELCFEDKVIKVVTTNEFTGRTTCGLVSYKEFDFNV